ncbi:unnamed protein product [Closterium sp. NIES-53]
MASQLRHKLIGSTTLKPSASQLFRIDTRWQPVQELFRRAFASNSNSSSSSSSSDGGLSRDNPHRHSFVYSWDSPIKSAPQQAAQSRGVEDVPQMDSAGKPLHSQRSSPSPASTASTTTARRGEPVPNLKRFQIYRWNPDEGGKARMVEYIVDTTKFGPMVRRTLFSWPFLSVPV